ncbi:hypothetical protein [Streptomyces nigrescens]
MAMCGSGKSTGDVTHELAMATLHLLAARKQLHLAESRPSAPALVDMCDLLQGHAREIRALLVAMGLTDADLQVLLSSSTE